MKKGDCPLCSEEDVELLMGGLCRPCLKRLKEDLNSRRVYKNEQFFIGWKITPYELKSVGQLSEA